ncbi:glycosyltransferase [Tundrisphaera sp. TA3]|uniref:glycosyltransferase n=1 Tax=Tundrisphaera sp. TA3 TaxID=3435775 RepID=UPI003EBF0613
MRPIRVLTWHVHGNYLLYLSRARVEFHLAVGPGGSGGRGDTFPFPDRVIDVPAEEVRDREFDCILYQTRANYEVDGPAILSDAQRRLPRIYLEHDTPRPHPTDTRHWFDDPDGLLVHVTHFNALMWDSGRTPTRVIEHGVAVPEGVRYSGELARGITAINHLRSRGRLLGADIFERARAEVPIDLVGMDAESLGGLGEVHPMELAAFEARYRFFFHPIRWTSLGLAALEAMTLGMPVVGLATTELASAVDNGVSGIIDTDPARLIDAMRRLLRDPDEARRIGEGGRRHALERYGIERFARDWEATFAEVSGRSMPGTARVAPGLSLAAGGAR